MIINGETCPLKYEINTKIPDTPKPLSRDEMLDTQMQDIKDQIRSAARDMGIVTNNLIATCKRIPEYTPSASNSANTANFQAGKMCEYRVREEVKRLDQERSAKTMKLNAEYDRLGALLSDEWFNKMNQEEQIADEKVLINSGRSAACYECEKQAIKLNLTAGCVCEVRAQVSGHGIVTTCEPK
jgi:hypothetical protein